MSAGTKSHSWNTAFVKKASFISEGVLCFSITNLGLSLGLIIGSIVGYRNLLEDPDLSFLCKLQGIEILK